MNKAKTIPPQYTTGFITSKDGTIIGYRKLGYAPEGVILVHGGMMASQNFMKLANALASDFTVYVPDRRGRGLSGPAGDNYNLGKECEDIEVLAEKTEVKNIFGLSSGAIVCLQTALKLSPNHKVALYEPPLAVGGFAPNAWVIQFDKEIGLGKLAAAMVTVIKGTMSSPIMSKLPRFLLERLFNIAIKEDDMKIKGDDVPLRTLIPTMHYDAQLVTETKGQLENYKAINTEVLLLGGSKSASYLKSALNSLNNILLHVKRIEFPGLDHLAADNNGKPERVAAELRRFFA
jgi:pimeloyl-ACP methyl ester carboxylesterase